jgi:hypothetical protein
MAGKALATQVRTLRPRSPLPHEAVSKPTSPSGVYGESESTGGLDPSEPARGLLNHLCNHLVWIWPHHRHRP